jgi:hypothetical protein
VNDGKLASRLRNGGRITTETLDRIRGFMASHQGKPALSRPLVIERRHRCARRIAPTGRCRSRPASNDPQRNFRFFDNRQKYLLFVNTCSEKWVVASRVALELGNIHPRPPAVRVFDAGVGDGSVLVRSLRSMHDRFPAHAVLRGRQGDQPRRHPPHLAEDGGPFLEHPQTVLVLTNLAYADAPWLAVKSLSAASSMVWHELPLTGSTAHKFESQIMDLGAVPRRELEGGREPEDRQPRVRAAVVLVIYREDHKFLLDPIIPKPGGTVANYDLIIASQPYRARASVDFKAKRVIAPLARALGPAGGYSRSIPTGNDPGMEIIREGLAGDNPVHHRPPPDPQSREARAGPAGRDLNFNAYAITARCSATRCTRCPRRCPSRSARRPRSRPWNAAIYVAQIEDDRLGSVVSDGRYLDATREVLRKHNGLWFYDESYVISRRRD